MNEFWSDLRRPDLLFQRDRVPPIAWICDGRYYFATGAANRHRHTVHLPGCKPLDGRVTAKDAKVPPETDKPAENPKQTAQNEAQRCDPKALRCKLLKTALQSKAICPTKYARCRTEPGRLHKSVDCPLKYPRCRWFVGPEPRVMRSASRHSRAIGVKR